MKRSRSAFRVAASAAALILAAVPVSGDEPPPSAVRAPKVHADTEALERAVADATIAYIRSDTKSVRAALDRVEAGCRRISREEIPALSSEMVLYDEAFHKTVDLAREFAGRGVVETSFDQFVWMQKACRTCHDIAKKLTLYPANTRPVSPR